MKTILMVGGVGLLAYALYEWLMASQQAPASTATGTAATGSGFTPGSSTSTGSPAPQPPPPAPSGTITAAVLNSAAKGDPAVDANGMATVYVWNYYYSNLSGAHQTFTTPNPLAAISASTYLALRHTAGLSGFTHGNFNPYTMKYPVLASRMVH
jgi:hypothetical protein